MGNSEKIGLVLCGGGAKGSFELGVWKELEMLGLADKITGFSGTSIGAVNTALFLADNSLADKEKIWESFKQTDMLDAKYTLPQIFRAFITGNFTVLLSYFLMNGVFSQDKLTQLLAQLKFNENKIRKYDIFPTVTDVCGFKTTTAFIDWKRLSIKEIKKYVLCSATLPIFNGYHLSKRFMHILVDGGVVDVLRHNLSNTPIAPLYAKGYRKFIVIYLSEEKSFEKQIEKEDKWFSGSDICRIFPGENLFKNKSNLVRLAEVNSKLTKERIEAGQETVRKLIMNSELHDFHYIPTSTNEDNEKSLNAINDCIKLGEQIANGQVELYLSQA